MGSREVACLDQNQDPVSIPPDPDQDISPPVISVEMEYVSLDDGADRLRKAIDLLLKASAAPTELDTQELPQEESFDVGNL